LDNVSINKNFLHTLIVTGVERQAAGVWCFNPPAGPCRYFDWNGNIWGDAIRSSGFLVLNVDDMRSSVATALDPQFLPVIQTAVKYFNDHQYPIENVTIPVGSFTEFDMTTNGYMIKFSTDSNIAGQLDVFKTFKEQKIDTGQVQPQYLDLRYDGRVYYK